MKKLKNIILTFILMFVIICSVNAEKQYSIDVEAETGNAGPNFSMTFNGITDYEAVRNNQIKYYVKFVNDLDSKPSVQTDDEIEEANETLEGIHDFFDVYVAYDTDKKIYTHNISGIPRDWYILEGYNKAYVIRCEDDSSTAEYEHICKVSDNPITVEKPALPKLSQRYQNYLFNTENWNKLSVFPFFPYSYSDGIGDHELNVKVGLINDQNLLKKIARNEAGSLEELMEYAKKTNGTIFTEKDTDFHDVSINDFKVTNGAYYYMYTYYTNKDGLYRNLDDITVVMGDSDMLVNDVDWSKYNTTSLWDKYVEKYKTTDIIKTYTDNSVSVDIKSTDTSLTSTIDDGAIKLVGNFNHDNGVVSYLPLNDKEVSFETIFNEDIIIENAIVALANLKGYDAKKLKTWLYENEGKLSLEKDGIEYILEDYTKEQDNGVTLTVKKVKSFNFKLDSDFKFDAKKVENPKTGINLNYKILLGIIVIGMGAYLYTRKKSKFPKHN